MIVKPEYCRSREFAAFGFRIDDFGIPFIEDVKFETTSTNRRKTITPVDIEITVHYEILDSIFKIEKEIRYKELQSQVKDYFMRHGVKFGENKAVEFITYYLNQEMIFKVAGIAKYPFYSRKC